MKLDHLSYFLEAAKHQNLSLAAKSIPISISAVSYAIDQIEQELGQSLFSRSGRNVVLTDTGRNLVVEGSGLLESHQKLVRKLQSDQRGQYSGRIRIGTDAILGSVTIAKLWPKLVNLYPKLEIIVSTNSTAIVTEKVLKSELDVGICLGPKKIRQLEVAPLYEGHLRLVLGKNHPLLKIKKKINLNELKKYRATFFNPSNALAASPQYSKEVLKIVSPIDSACLWDNDLIGVELLKNTQCWSIIPDLVADRFKKDLVQIEVQDWVFPYQVGVINLSGAGNRNISKTIFEVCQNIISEQKTS